MTTEVQNEFTYESLDNGVFTPLKDVIMSGSEILSDTTVEYRLVDQDEERTLEAGIGCYSSIYFPNSFDGTITLGYNTWNSTRSEIHADVLKLTSDIPSYNDIPNKASVVSDNERNDIDFGKITDVESLLAHYLMIQQHSGKQMASSYVIARALDTYFDTYWKEILIHVSSGYIEPSIPWIRLNNLIGNTLTVEGDSLSITESSVTTTLNPIDSVLENAITEICTKVDLAWEEGALDGVIQFINSNYNTRTYSSDVKLDETFKVSSDGITFTSNGVTSTLGWSVRTETALQGATEARVFGDNALLSQLQEDDYSTLMELMKTTFNNYPSPNCYSLEDATLTIDDVTLNLIKPSDITEVEELIINKDDFKYGSKFVSTVDEARAIASITDSYVIPTLYNTNAKTIEDMLEYLA